MYNNPYYNVPTLDRIDAQIQELQRQRSQAQQLGGNPPSINQTFQLAPSTSMKMVNSIDEVQKELVFTDTAFFSKDMKVLWTKNAKGEIRTYELNEIIQKDEKDLMIDKLLLEIEEMKKNEQSINKHNANAVENKEPTISKSIRRNDK